jgi:Flavodoxin domain
MKALVVYESMYGNTRTIAEAIGSGLGAHADVVPVREAAPDQLAIVELLVVGGPTHVRGLSQRATRQAARDAAGKPGSTLTLESAAAFDTRVDMPAIFAGRASVGIARLLRSHGAQLVAPVHSFRVDKQNHLLEAEYVRAHAWGEDLARAVRPT